MVLQQIVKIFLSIVGLMRRALCFARRRNSKTITDPDEIINIVIDGYDYAAPQRQRQQLVERDWNSWDDSPRTVEEHIEQYRQRIAKPPTPPPQENDQDFFSELTPMIKPQLKYYLDVDDPKIDTNFSRLEAKIDVPIAINADLEDWEEEHAGGWEELDTEQTKQMIRDKRRELRNQRQKAMKSHDPHEDTNGIGATRLTNAHISKVHT